MNATLILLPILKVCAITQFVYPQHSQGKNYPEMNELMNELMNSTDIANVNILM
jgi:hypothetical protein